MGRWCEEYLLVSYPKLFHAPPAPLPHPSHALPRLSFVIFDVLYLSHTRKSNHQVRVPVQQLLSKDPLTTSRSIFFLPPSLPSPSPPLFFFFLSLSFEVTTANRRTSKCSWRSCNLLLIEGSVSGVSFVLSLPPSPSPFCSLFY